MKRTTIEIIAIALIVLSFMLAQITASPADYGVPLLAARYLALVVGSIGIVLRYIPAPRAMDIPPPDPPPAAVVNVNQAQPAPAPEPPPALQQVP